MTGEADVAILATAYGELIDVLAMHRVLDPSALDRVLGAHIPRFSDPSVRDALQARLEKTVEGLRGLGVAGPY